MNAITPLAALIIFTLCAGTTRAHTLPISYLTVVSDADYIHLELTINPFELNCLSEAERDRNGGMAGGQTSQRETTLSAEILKCLKLSVAGKELPADVAGLVADPDSHHLTLRAHYKADARHSQLTIESSLTAITSGSHRAQVSYGNGGTLQKAILDGQCSKVTFEPSLTEPRASASAFKQPESQKPEKARALVPILGTAGTCTVLIWLLRRAVQRSRDRLQEAPATDLHKRSPHSYPNPS